MVGSTEGTMAVIEAICWVLIGLGAAGLLVLFVAILAAMGDVL